jgi:hypothetical protein
VPVVIAEGEKAADAAALIFPNSVSVTSCDGAGSAAKSDWSALSGRDTLIWRDNDRAGAAYAEAIVKAIAPIARSIRMVDSTRLAEEFAEEGERDGWDCADGLEAWAPEDLREAALESMFPLNSGPDGANSAPRTGEAPKSDPEGEARPSSTAEPEASSSAYADLLERARSLAENDDVALRGLAHDAAAMGLSEERLDQLARAASKSSRFALPAVRKAFAQAEDRRAAAARNDPAARAAAAAAKAAMRKSEAARSWTICRDLALAPDLMDRAEKICDRLGVVGEGAAARGAYLVMTSRLLRNNALSLLRRGAPSAGKNYLIGAALQLMPAESVLRLSGASPTALVYFGAGDEDALARKIIVVAEAAAIAARASGDENPTTVLLRTLLSEGRIDRLVTVPQREGLSQSFQVTRNGPVVLILTSARENVDPEMLTRLLVVDADESRRQTLAIVKRRLANAPRAATAGELDVWLALQRWLEAEGPYDVAVPFAEAIYAAYARLIVAFPLALQVRMRRDVGALVTAVEASAALHRAQRATDESGRIVATLDDYRHAWNAFNSSVSALYRVRTRAEIVAAVRAAEGMGAAEKGDSVKITVAAMRKALGINSNDVAANRLREATEYGALEEDDSKRGVGRGSPRFFWLRVPSVKLEAEPGLSVFPEPDEVAK